MTNYGTSPGSSAAALTNPEVDQPGETGRQPAANRSFLLKILLVFVLACAFFGLWIPQAYSGDDLQYAGVIKQATSHTFLFHPAGGRDYDPVTNAAHFNPGETISIINPRYLLEWPTSVATVNLWKLFGWQGDVLEPVQTLRVIVGALGLLFFFLAVRTLTGNGWLAGLSSAGLAVTVSYWTYSTRMDQSINMVALLCVAFYLLVRSKQNGTIGSWRANLPLLAVLVLAAFYNFTGVLTAAVFGVAIAWARPGEALKVRLVRLLSFGAFYAGLIVVLGAAGLALLISPARLFDAEYWKTATFAGHPEYGVELADTFRAVIGFAKSQVSFPGLDPTGSLSSFWDAASIGSKVVLLAFYAVVLAVMALPFVVFFYRRKLDSDRQWARLLVTGWLVVYSLFNLWWDPGYTKYWLIPLVCLWAAIALALQKIRLEFNRLYRPALGLAALLIVVTFGFNFTTQFLPNSNKSNNASLNASVQLGQKTDPGALFISTGQPVDFYMVYFAQRDVVSIELINYSANGDTGVTNQILADHIKQHRAAGKPVYVYGLETLTPAERANLLTQIGGATDPKLAFSFPDLKVYQVYPAAPALSVPATPVAASRS